MAEQTVILRYKDKGEDKQEILDLPLDEPYIERLFKLKNIILRDAGHKAIQLHRVEAGKTYDIFGDSWDEKDLLLEQPSLLRFDQRKVYEYYKGNNKITKWSMNSLPKAASWYDRANNLWHANVLGSYPKLENVTEKELRPQVKRVLERVAQQFGQGIWEEGVPIHMRLKDELYPDFGSFTKGEEMPSTERIWSKLRLLFEVESEVSKTVKKGSMSSLELKTKGEQGVGQLCQWLSVPENREFSVKYGAVTDYLSWVFVKATRTPTSWELFISSPEKLMEKNYKTESCPGALHHLFSLFVDESISYNSGNFQH